VSVDTQWEDRDHDWLEQLPPGKEQPTHRIVWRPTVVVDVAIPPWRDVEDVLAGMATAWNDAVPDDQNWWYDGDVPPCWVVAMEITDSTQEIAEAEA
jgi:hypothetical protein